MDLERGGGMRLEVRLTAQRSYRCIDRLNKNAFTVDLWYAMSACQQFYMDSFVLPLHSFLRPIEAIQVR